MFAWKKLFVTSPQTDNCVAIVKKKHYAQAKDTRISVSLIFLQTKAKLKNCKNYAMAKAIKFKMLFLDKTRNSDERRSPHFHNNLTTIRVPVFNKR